MDVLHIASLVVIIDFVTAAAAAVQVTRNAFVLVQGSPNLRTDSALAFGADSGEGEDSDGKSEIAPSKLMGLGGNCQTVCSGGTAQTGWSFGAFRHQFDRTSTVD